MKKFIYIILLVFVIWIGFNSLIRVDVPQVSSENQYIKTDLAKIKYPPNPKTVTINGTDYLQSQADIGKFGGSLVSSTIGEGPKTFNPFNTKDATSASMAELMFDGLVTSNPLSGAVVPKLAKSFVISPDGRVYTFYLRKGITWSDKMPITADDVVFTWNDIILKGLGNTSTRDSVLIDGEFPTVKKIDDYTVEFVIKKPFAPFLRILSASIAPKHIFAPVVKKGPKYFESFWSTTTSPSKFVTSGPFRLKEYKPAQRVVFERNPDYYVINKNSEKLPYLDRIIYLIVGDLNNETLKFEAKELDVIGLRGSNVGRYKKIEPKSDFIVYAIGPDTGTMFVTMNMNTRKNSSGKFYVEPKKQFWFNDKNFRYAIDYALDRKAMLDNVANGVASPLFTAESLNSIYLNKSLANGHPMDIQKAKAYLKKSGFYWQNKTLYDRFGNKVEFDLYTNAGNTEREAIGVMVKQDLEELGMKVNFKPIEFNSLVNKLVNTLDWDMVIMGLTGSPLEPHSGKNVWYSNGSLHVFNQRLPEDLKKSDDRYPWEKRLDNIMDAASLRVKFSERKPLYDEYQVVVNEEKPIIYLYSPSRIVAIRKKFKNVRPTPLSGVIYNLDEIYIDNTVK